jgi:hypothetical protein
MIFCALILTLFQTSEMTTLVVESSAVLFQKAVSMTSAADGTIYVADLQDNSVHIVRPDNSAGATIGGKGWGTEGFDRPLDVSTSFLLDLFVADNTNRRVQRFDKQLQFIQGYDEDSFDGDGQFQPIATAVSLTGDLFVLDADGKRVLQLNSRSQIEKEFGNYTASVNSIREPKDIAVSDDNEAIVLDGNKILMFDLYGNFIRSTALSTSHDWRTVSVNGRMMIVTAFDQILMIHLDTQLVHTIEHSSFIGERVSALFSDALIQNDHLIVLTNTTVYRCSFTMP